MVADFSGLTYQIVSVCMKTSKTVKICGPVESRHENSHGLLFTIRNRDCRSTWMFLVKKMNLREIVSVDGVLDLLINQKPAHMNRELNVEHDRTRSFESLVRGRFSSHTENPRRVVVRVFQNMSQSVGNVSFPLLTVWHTLI